MANIQIKRKTGASTYENLYPATTIGQVSGLQTALDNKLDDTQLGAANGVASLDSGGKVPYSQLPSSVTGGMRFVSVIDPQDQGVSDTLATIASYNSLDEVSDIGKYFIVAQNATMTAGSAVGNYYGQYQTEEVDDGIDPTTSLDLEAGDWLVVQNVQLNTPTSGKFTVTFGVVNNTYADATTTNKGVVTLTDATNMSDVGDADSKVITENFMFDVKVADGTDLYNLGTPIANKLAPASHTHSQYQPVDPTLTALAGVTTAANKVIYATGADTFTTTDLTSFGRSLIDDADNTAARSTLGLVIGTNVQAYDAGLQSIAGLTTAADNIIYTTALDTYATATLTSFGRSLIDDADNTAARSTLGVVIGTNVQAYDAGLQSIAGLTTAADKMIYTTGSDTYAVTDLTSFGRSLLDDADNTAARSTLGVVIGTNVQAYSANLAAIAGLAVTDSNIIVGNGTTWVAESGATARTSLGVYSTSEVDTAISNKPNIYYDLAKSTADSDAPVGAYIFDDLATSNGW